MNKDEEALLLDAREVEVPRDLRLEVVVLSASITATSSLQATRPLDYRYLRVL
jgi:hypothetical protein